MFLPPGHSSAVKIIGQFSIPMRTECFSAKSTNGPHVLSILGQLSSTLLV